MSIQVDDAELARFRRRKASEARTAELRRKGILAFDAPDDDDDDDEGGVGPDGEDVDLSFGASGGVGGGLDASTIGMSFESTGGPGASFASSGQMDSSGMAATAGRSAVVDDSVAQVGYFNFLFCWEAVRKGVVLSYFHLL